VETFLRHSVDQDSSIRYGIWAKQDQACETHSLSLQVIIES